MPQYLAILWFPLLASLFVCFSKLKYRIYTVSFIIIAGALQYGIPILWGYRGVLWLAGLIFLCLLVITYLIIHPQVKFKKYSDKKIWNAISIYYIFTFFSVLTHYESVGTFPSYISQLFSYVPLFYLIIISIKTQRDIDIIIKTLIFAGFLMALIGIMQFYTNDSMWGQQSSRRIDPITDREYYQQSEYVGYLKGYTGVGSKFRVCSTASNPNAFGTVLIMVIPLTLFYIQKNRKIWLYVTFLSFQIFGLFITGSRLPFIGLFFILFFAWLKGLLLGKSHRISNIIYFMLIVSILYKIFSDQFFLSTVFNRLTTISYDEIVLSNPRLTKSWIPAFNEHLNLGYMIFGKALPGPSKGNVHNNFLGILFYSGFVGFLAYMFVIYRYIILALNIDDQKLRYALILSLVGFVITGMGYVSFRHMGPPVIFWTIIGIVASKYCSKYQRNNIN